MTIPQYGVFTPDNLGIVLVSGLTNAAVDTWYRGDATSAAFTVNLPITNVDGATVIVENTSTGANNITVARSGSTDTIEGSTSIAVAPGAYIELTYRVADAVWYRRRRTWEPTAGTDMRRSSTGTAQTAAGVAAGDVVNKGQLDTAYKGYTPPSTMVAMPANVLSMSNATPATGVPAFFPIDVGPKSLTIKALWCNVTTAQSGGTGTLVKGAVYSDDGTGGAPLLISAGKLTEVTFVATSTGIKQGTLSSNLVLPPGRYWLCGLYYQGSTAPTTAPQLACVSNATALWCPNNAFAIVRYLTTTATVTDLPVAGQALTGSGASTGMVVGMQAN